jgi:hypothetical protein
VIGMFKSVRIQNFRQFKDLTLDNLAQINLITGANNTGKTSLLEALFLHVTPTNPGIVLTIADLRGVSGVVAEGLYAWGFLFRDGASDKPILIESADMNGGPVRLEVRVSETQNVMLKEPSVTNGSSTPAVISTARAPYPSLELRYFATNLTGTPDSVSSIRLEQDQSVFSAPRMPPRPFFYLANRPSDSSADARRFSRLVELRRAQDVVDALRKLEPRLNELTVLVQPSGPTVAADIGPGTLVPTSYMGQGFERLLSIVPAIMLSEGGTVLIDEIDAGLHYSVLPDVWRIIVSTAIEHGVQVFATTHSYECIQAALAAAGSDEDKLALYRLSRRDGDVRATRVGHEGMRAAADFALELR